MTQDFFLGQLRLIAVAVIAYFTGTGKLSSADGTMIGAVGMPLLLLFGPWVWSIYTNINQKLVPKDSVAIAPHTPQDANAAVGSNVAGKVVGALLACIVLPMMLGGCQGIAMLQRAENTTVEAPAALAASYAYDAIESSATAYLVYCNGKGDAAPCSAANRRAVIKYTRAGRAARNQVETYVQTATPVPAAIYNAMVAATANLKSTPAVNGSAQ